MSTSIRDTIEKLTPSAVARAMQLPLSTVFRWMKEDRIPGRGTAHEWRRRQFDDAVKALEPRARKAKRKAA
jgi:hypothetical protein